MTLNLIETLKTSIYNPKHTKNMKPHVIFNLFKTFVNPYSPTKKTSKISACFADLH